MGAEQLTTSLLTSLECKEDFSLIGYYENYPTALV